MMLLSFVVNCNIVRMILRRISPVRLLHTAISYRITSLRAAAESLLALGVRIAGGVILRIPRPAFPPPFVEHGHVPPPVLFRSNHPSPIHLVIPISSPAVPPRLASRGSPRGRRVPPLPPLHLPHDGPHPPQKLRLALAARRMRDSIRHGIGGEGFDLLGFRGADATVEGQGAVVPYRSDQSLLLGGAGGIARGFRRGRRSGADFALRRSTFRILSGIDVLRFDSAWIFRTAVRSLRRTTRVRGRGGILTIESKGCFRKTFLVVVIRERYARTRSTSTPLLSLLASRF
mmetsp:Transcript_32312/g.59237  ORF Transcript_32312/g.59237 Transcript_32312/m.59237 type:complete len:288 (-) Transcript_32312:298-1161(-)